MKINLGINSMLKKTLSVARAPYFLSFFASKAQTFFNKALPFLKKQKTLLMILFLALLASDLLILKSYEHLLPKEKLSPLKVSSFVPKNSDQKNYKALWEKNIFHRGPIPLKLVGQVSTTSQNPVKTSLSFQLKGTIVHANPSRSVATIKDQNSKTLSYVMGSIIGGQAKVTRIERGRVIFFNQNNNRSEYINLPEDQKISIVYNKLKPSTSLISGNSIIQRKGDKFEVNRSDINTHLNQLHEVLQQARVIPYRVERDGRSVIEGYTFAKIDKDSIYEDLGFKVGDIIKSVNGESINNPQKALELFEEFKTSSDVKVLVERDGNEVEYKYRVNEDSPIN